jgi:hypothetical protein
MLVSRSQRGNRIFVASVWQKRGETGEREKAPAETSAGAPRFGLRTPRYRSSDSLRTIGASPRNWAFTK